jgi:hypothetical protein
MSILLNKINKQHKENKCNLILSLPIAIIGEVISFILCPQTICNFHQINKQMNDMFSSNDNDSIYSIALKGFFKPLMCINYCYSTIISPKELFKSLVLNFLSKTSTITYKKNSSIISKSFAGNGSIGKFLSNREKFFYINNKCDRSMLIICPCCLSDILFDKQELIINNEDSCCYCCRSFNTKNVRKGFIGFIFLYIILIYLINLL